MFWLRRAVPLPESERIELHINVGSRWEVVETRYSPLGGWGSAFQPKPESAAFREALVRLGAFGGAALDSERPAEPGPADVRELEAIEVIEAVEVEARAVAEETPASDVAAVESTVGPGTDCVTPTPFDWNERKEQISAEIFALAHAEEAAQQTNARSLAERPANPERRERVGAPSGDFSAIAGVSAAPAPPARPEYTPAAGMPDGGRTHITGPIRRGGGRRRDVVRLPSRTQSGKAATPSAPPAPLKERSRSRADQWSEEVLAQLDREAAKAEDERPSREDTPNPGFDTAPGFTSEYLADHHDAAQHISFEDAVRVLEAFRSAEADGAAPRAEKQRDRRGAHDSVDESVRAGIEPTHSVEIAVDEFVESMEAAELREQGGRPRGSSIELIAPDDMDAAVEAEAGETEAEADAEEALARAEAERRANAETPSVPLQAVDFDLVRSLSRTGEISPAEPPRSEVHGACTIEVEAADLVEDVTDDAEELEDDEEPASAWVPDGSRSVAMPPPVPGSASAELKPVAEEPVVEEVVAVEAAAEPLAEEEDDLPEVEPMPSASVEVVALESAPVEAAPVEASSVEPEPTVEATPLETASAASPEPTASVRPDAPEVSEEDDLDEVEPTATVVTRPGRQRGEAPDLDLSIHSLWEPRDRKTPFGLPGYMRFLADLELDPTPLAEGRARGALALELARAASRGKRVLFLGDESSGGDWALIFEDGVEISAWSTNARRSLVAFLIRINKLSTAEGQRVHDLAAEARCSERAALAQLESVSDHVLRRGLFAHTRILTEALNNTASVRYRVFDVVGPFDTLAPYRTGGATQPKEAAQESSALHPTPATSGPAHASAPEGPVVARSRGAALGSRTAPTASERGSAERQERAKPWRRTPTVEVYLTREDIALAELAAEIETRAARIGEVDHFAFLGVPFCATGREIVEAVADLEARLADGPTARLPIEDRKRARDIVAWAQHIRDAFTSIVERRSYREVHFDRRRIEDGTAALVHEVRRALDAGQKELAARAWLQLEELDQTRSAALRQEIIGSPV